MSRPSRLRQPCLPIALALLSIAPALHAQTAAERVEVELDGRVGRATAPYSTRAFPRASGYGGFLIVTTRVRIAPRWRLGSRVPLALMRVEQPAGALYDEAAWGNPELDAELAQPWLERNGWKLGLKASLAVGAPVAEHDAAQLAGRALVLANALEGFSEPALFTPGMLPVTPAASLRVESRRWLFSASLRLPSLFRISRADLPSESKPRSFGLVPVAALEAELHVWRWLSVSATPRLTVQALAPVDDHAPRWQFLAAGRVNFYVADRLWLSTLVQAPVGGSLGGSTLAGGLALSGKL